MPWFPVFGARGPGTRPGSEHVQYIAHQLAEPAPHLVLDPRNQRQPEQSIQERHRSEKGKCAYRGSGHEHGGPTIRSVVGQFGNVLEPHVYASGGNYQTLQKKRVPVPCAPAGEYGKDGDPHSEDELQHFGRANRKNGLRTLQPTAGFRLRLQPIGIQFLRIAGLVFFKCLVSEPFKFVL